MTMHRSLSILAVALAAALPSAAGQWPAPVQALEARGLEIVGRFAAPGGMSGFAGVIQNEPVAVYLAPDGKHAVIGAMVDAGGRNLTDDALEKAVGGKLGARTWKKLESSSWIGDGPAGAPRVIYAFMDPNCPYCNQFWRDVRPWVEAGKVQVRHVMVGILAESSAPKAAAILSAPDPAGALAAHERDRASGGIKPATTVDAATRSRLAANEALMRELGSAATPTIFYRDSAGAVKKVQGVPPAGVLAAMLGPR